MSWNGARAARARLDGRPDPIYDEDTFRYLLTAERKRADRSGRPFFLLTVQAAERPGQGVRLDPAVAGRLFGALSLALRETDFVGWYRGERVAGAVLTELGEASRSERAAVVGERVGAALRAELAPDVLRRLQVTVYRYPEIGTGDPGGRVQPVDRVDQSGEAVPRAWAPAVGRALELAVGVAVLPAVYLASLMRAGSRAAIPEERNA